MIRRRIAIALVFSATCILGSLSISCNRPKEAKVDVMFVGAKTICARLVSGEIRCAGANLDHSPGGGFATLPAAFRGAKSVAFGDEDGCVLTYDKSVLCFGPHYKPFASPDELSSGADMLASGGNFFCLRGTFANTATCYAGMTRANDPFGNASLKDAIAIAAGGGSACFLGQDKYARCFFATESVMLEHVEKIATWGDRACGVREDGDVVCAVKADVLGGKAKGVVAHNARDLTLDAHGLCTLQVTNTVFCEQNGVLAPLQGVFSIASIAAAGGNRCYVNADHRAFCWGDNANAELGTQGPKEVPAPLFFRETAK